MAEDSIRTLADTIHAPRPLDEPDDRPGQVVIDDDCAILKVLAFRKYIGGNEHAEFVAGGYLFALTVRFGRKAPNDLGRIQAFARSFVYARDAPRNELAFQVARRIGEPGEDQWFFLAVAVCDQFAQFRQFGVPGPRRRRNPAVPSGLGHPAGDACHESW